MSVYVDALIQHGGPTSPALFRTRKSCHMYADTLEELHAMATAIGLKMAWFQDSKSLQHYDLIESKRKAAIRLGAVEHGRSEMVAFIREQRRTI